MERFECGVRHLRASVELALDHDLEHLPWRDVKGQACPERIAQRVLILADRELADQNEQPGPLVKRGAAGHPTEPVVQPELRVVRIERVPELELAPERSGL